MNTPTIKADETPIPLLGCDRFGPLPWRAQWHVEMGLRWPEIVDANGAMVCEFDEDEEIGFVDLLVRACNAHAEFLAVLAGLYELADAAEQCCCALCCTGDGSTHSEDCPMERARALLAALKDVGATPKK